MIFITAFLLSVYFGAFVYNLYLFNAVYFFFNCLLICCFFIFMILELLLFIQCFLLPHCVFWLLTQFVISVIAIHHAQCSLINWFS